MVTINDCVANSQLNLVITGSSLHCACISYTVAVAVTVAVCVKTKVKKGKNLDM